MSETRTVPELRFPGFTDDWEQRKLGEIVDVRSGRDYKHLTEGDIPVYGTGGYMLSVNKALSYNEDAIGIGRKGTINKPYLLKAPFWTVDTLFYAIPVSENDLYFINNIFQRINWKLYDESTGVPSLSKFVIKKVDTMIPKQVEQKQIGAFFKTIDDTITLHQRKLELLKEMKKGFLQKMFPKKGAKVPEVRFPGFTDDWEQRKLGDLLTRSEEVQPESPSNIQLITVQLRHRGIIPSGKYPKPTSNGRPYFIRHEGELIIGRQNFHNGGFGIAKNNVEGLIASNAIQSFDFKDNIIPYFLISSMQRQDWLKRTEIFIGGTGQKEYSTKTLLSLLLEVPTLLEQKKIGSFFQRMDEAIDLHQRKVELLKEMKKGFLQKMFV